MNIPKKQFIEKYSKINLKNENHLEKEFEQVKYFPKINNDNNTHFQKFTSDFVNLLKLSLNFKFDKNDSNNDSIHIINFIKDFLSFGRNLHYINLISKKFTRIRFQKIITSNVILKYKKVIYPKYIDLYHITTFKNILFSIIYHIFIIDKDQKNKELKEIYEYIFQIFFEIYLNGIEQDPLNFLYLIIELDNYIYKKNVKKEKSLKNENETSINQFLLFLFSGFQKLP